MKHLTATALLVSLSLAPSIWADTLVLENGRELEGILIEETEDSIVFKMKVGSQITLPLAGIRNLVRSDSSELVVLEGDAFLQKGEFEEAHEVYQEALRAGSDLALERLNELNRILEEQVDGILEGLTLEDAEERLREELGQTTTASPYWRIQRSRLSHILSEKGKRSLDNRSPELAIKNFSEAWKLDPDNGDFGEEFLQALKVAKAPKDTIVEFLTEHIQRHPGQQGLNQELASMIWKQRPCEAADLLILAGNPIDTTHPGRARNTPRIFRRCFFEDPFPEGASLARTEYYEIFLALDPTGDRSPLYRAQLKVDPDDVNLYSEYATYLVEQERSEEAERVYREWLTVDPGSIEAKEFLRMWEIEKEKIATQEVAARIRELERSYQIVASLTREDFPLINDTTKLDGLLHTARELTSILDSRPVALEGDPSSGSLSEMERYRQTLGSATRIAKVREVLVQTSKVRVKPKINDRAPDFSLTDLRGTPVSLSDYSGKTVLLYFWASWCPACKKEMSLFRFLGDIVEDRQDFHIVGVSLDTEESALDNYLRSNPMIDWPQAFDGKGWESSAAMVYAVDALPSSVVIDGDGIIRAINPRGQKLIDSVLGLLNKPGQPTLSLKIQGQPPFFQ